MGAGPQKAEIQPLRETQEIKGSADARKLALVGHAGALSASRTAAAVPAAAVPRSSDSAARYSFTHVVFN